MVLSQMTLEFPFLNKKHCTSTSQQKLKLIQFDARTPIKSEKLIETPTFYGHSKM